MKSKFLIKTSVLRASYHGRQLYRVLELVKEELQQASVPLKTTIFNEQKYVQMSEAR